MPKIRVNGLDHYYEQTGEGPSLVLVHGAFSDARMWEPQWRHFAGKNRLLRYDLRGHGRTGASDLYPYTVDTFADDLASLLQSLDIPAPIVCGQSFGGIVAQAFAVRNPNRLKALVLAGTMVSIDLTLLDKLLCNVLFPKWAMLLMIRALSAEDFTRFSLWLGRLAKGKQFLSQSEATEEYLKQCMLQMESSEYAKIWSALYEFRLLPLERITCPTLVLNGELEPASLLRHTEEILRRVPKSQAKTVPASRHASNMDNPRVFNEYVEQFLH